MLSSLRWRIELLFAAPLPPCETFGLASSSRSACQRHVLRGLRGISRETARIRSDWAIQEPHDLARPFAALLGAFACAWDLGAFLALDLEARRVPGTLPIRGSMATMSSQARSAASSKSGASAGRTCQPVTSFPNT